MADDALYHRTFVWYNPRPVLKPSAPATCSTLCHAPQATRPVASFDPLVLTPSRDSFQFPAGGGLPQFPVNGTDREPEPPRYDPSQRRVNALVFVGASLTGRVIATKRGQRFADYATPWELRHSILCSYDAPFQPVVDEDGTVVGHCGLVNGRDLISAAGWSGSDLDRGLEAGPIFVHEEGRRGTPPPGWAVFGFSDFTYSVMTSIDGEVLGGSVASRRDALEPITWKDVLKGAMIVADLVMDVMLVMAVADLVLKGGTLLVKSLVRRAVRRAVLRGATRELAAKFARRELGAVASELKPYQESLREVQALLKDAQAFRNGRPVFKNVKEFDRYWRRRGFRLLKNEAFGPAGGRQLIYEGDKNVIVKFKSAGYKDGPRMGKATMSLEVSDGKGVGWENALFKVDGEGKIVAKNLHIDGEIVRLPPDHPGRKLGLEFGIRNPQSGNVQALTKFEVIQGGQGPIPNKQLWADRGHLDFPPGFDGAGADRLQPGK
jgi:hypothetical protein